MAEFRGHCRGNGAKDCTSLNPPTIRNQRLTPKSVFARRSRMLRDKTRRAVLCIAGIAAIALLVVRAQAQQPAPTSYGTGILGAIDHRKPITQDAWPWVSIGRVNVIHGLGHRSYCTGTLIGPLQVLTAAHCLFDTRLNSWVKPQQV